MTKNTLLLLVALSATAAIYMSACSKEKSVERPPVVPTFPAEIIIHNISGTNPLVLNTATYTNGLGENYVVTAFRYYLSHLTLINTETGKRWSADDLYFLIDAADPASTQLNVPFAKGTYNRLRFLIGVDSIRNVSGAQTGALDVMYGMFWTWSSGYVMAKLEGTSVVAPPPTNAFTYHIGGFRPGESALRWVDIDLPAGNEVTVSDAGMPRIILNADVNKWFDAVNSLPISATGFIHSPGGIALKYADNYARMFTLVSSGNP